VGRPEWEPHGRQTSAGCGRAESPDFLPARFCGRSASRGAACRAASFMCPTHLWLGLEVLQCMDHEELSHLSQWKISNRPKEINAVSTPTCEKYEAPYFSLGEALTVGPFQLHNVTHSHLQTKKSFSKSFRVSSWWMPYSIESFFSKGLAHEVFTLHQLTAHNYVNPWIWHRNSNLSNFLENISLIWHRNSNLSNFLENISLIWHRNSNLSNFLENISLEVNPKAFRTFILIFFPISAGNAAN
jgi:hypothetical protein